MTCDWPKVTAVSLLLRIVVYTVAMSAGSDSMIGA